MQQWLDILREKNALAEQLGEKIPRFLAYEALTLDQATRLHIFLESHAREMEKLVEEIGEVDLPDALCQAAAALDDIFADLASSAANKVVDLRQSGNKRQARPNFVHG
jgi:hypothetical protein